MKPGRWEVRQLDDGKRRLLFWIDDGEEAAALDLTTEQARELAQALLREPL